MRLALQLRWPDCPKRKNASVLVEEGKSVHQGLLVSSSLVLVNHYSFHACLSNSSDQNLLIRDFNYERAYPQASSRTIPAALAIVKSHGPIVVFQPLPNAQAGTHTPVFLGSRLEGAHLVSVLIHLCFKAPAQ